MAINVGKPIFDDLFANVTPSDKALSYTTAISVWYHKVAGSVFTFEISTNFFCYENATGSNSALYVIEGLFDFGCIYSMNLHGNVVHT